MFNKKRKTSKYRFAYGKSPSFQSKITRRSKIQRVNKTQFRYKRVIIMAFILVGSLYSIYMLFFANYFTITEILCTNTEIEAETLTKRIQTTISKEIGENLVFTDTNKIEANILSTYPELKEIDISKKYPNKLEISFAKYPMIANIINESSSVRKSYIINSIGFTMKEDFENPNLPYIRIQSEEPINTETSIIEPSTITYILETKIYFEEKFGMGIKEIQYKPIAREIHLLTNRDFYIWIDIQRSHEQQLKKLKKSLVKLDIYNENFWYIDLRIAGTNGDKIIYKRK